MSHREHMMKLYDALSYDNQLIALANIYDLLKEQERESSRKEQIKIGSVLLSNLERLENLKVVR